MGRSTSTTLIPALARAPGDAGAVAGRPFHADPVNDPLIGEELDRAGITDGGSGELGVANHLADRGQHRDMDGVDVRVDPSDDMDCAAMMESSLSVQSGQVRRRLVPGGQDVDEVACQALIRSPRSQLTPSQWVSHCQRAQFQYQCQC